MAEPLWGPYLHVHTNCKEVCLAAQSKEGLPSNHMPRNLWGSPLHSSAVPRQTIERLERALGMRRESRHKAVGPEELKAECKQPTRAA